jgi:negative regulator of genetic competence, sporulation and motility
MDLILISSTKLKIMLTPDDMAAYSLTCDNIDYDNTGTRRAFWDILDVAKHKTGFDAASDRVFIQVYPSKSGGCEMYVTKLIKRDEAVQREDVKLYDKKYMIETPPVTLSVERDAAGHGNHDDYEVYSFVELYHLLNACRQLELSGYGGSSSIWTDDGTPHYYLAVDKTEIIHYGFLGEYGSKLLSPAAYTYLIEHCRCICEEDAVRTMSSLV